MSGFPHLRLLEVRGVRAECAAREHRVRQRELQDAITRLRQQEDALERLRAARDGEQRRLACGLTRSAEICRLISYIQALNERIHAQATRVEDLARAVAEAQGAALESARALRSARAREDAMQDRAGQWRREQRSRHERTEDEASQDIHRRLPTGGRP